MKGSHPDRGVTEIKYGADSYWGGTKKLLKIYRPDYINELWEIFSEIYLERELEKRSRNEIKNTVFIIIFSFSIIS